jgi:RNA polymerase sigma-70 factor (ECF subfamily)
MPAPQGDEAHRLRVAQLFKSEHDRVVHHVVAITGTWSEARDVAAQAFEKLLRFGTQGVGNLRAYVYQAARNIAVNRARDQSTRRKLDRIAIHELVSAGSSPEPEWVEAESLEQQQQRLRRLKTAIDKLPPRCRLALELRIWDDLTHAQILARFAAEGVIVNEKTVRRWLKYAFEFCRDEILLAEKSAGVGK